MEQQDFIKNLLDEHISEYIESYAFEEDVKEVIHKKVESKLSSKINSYIENKIDEAIDQVLKGEINTDDGWGKREHFNSFEDMFKQRFNKKLNEDWEIRNIISKTVKERLDELFKKKAKEVSTKIQDMVLEEMLKGDVK